MANKTSVQFYYDYIEQLEDLDDEQFRKVILAMVKYDESNELIELDTICKMAFKFIKKRIDYDKESYITKCKKNKENIQKYWDKKKQTNTNEYERKQMNTKHTDIELELELELDKELDNNNNIYTFIENEYGRTLSSTEYLKIEEWLSWFNLDIIKYAFEISVLNNKRQFNYVNGILVNWKSCNYKTLQEIKNNETEDKNERNYKVISGGAIQLC